MIRITSMLVVLVLASMALAQPMAERVPSDAVVYVGWQGTDSLGAAYEKSHLKGVIDSSNIPEYFSEFLPRVIDWLGKENEQEADVLRGIYGIGRIVLSRPCALCLRGGDTSGAAPNSPLTLVVDAGGYAQKMMTALNPWVQKLARAGVQVVAGVHGNRFVTLSLKADISKSFAGLLGDGADQTAAPLSTRQEFKEAMGQVRKDSVVAFYIDAAAALKLVDRLAADKGPVIQQQMATVRDAIGLGGVKRIACSAGFDSPNWVVDCFVAGPTPHSGLLAMLDGKPLSDDLLKLIPKGATYVSAGRFDVPKAFAAIRMLLGAVNTDALNVVDRSTAIAATSAGVNLQTQLLEQLGDEWGVFGDENIGGNNMLGYVLVNRPHDAKTVEASLDKLGGVIGNIIAAQLPVRGTKVVARQTRIGDVNVRYCGVPYVSISWTIKDGNLYAAFQPQLVASAAAMAGKGGSIVDNPRFVAALRGMGNVRASSIEYVDLPETISSSYATTLALSRTLTGLAEIYGMEAPPVLVPPLHQLREHVGPSLDVSWADEAGWHSRSVSSFPGSSIFASEISLAVAQQGVAMSVLLPSLHRTMEATRRYHCASNMRSLGLAALKYAVDGKTRNYPATLGDLVDSVPNWQVFVCAGSDERPPAEILTDREKLAAWINQKTDYVYMGGILNFRKTGRETILMYEKPDNHFGGVNVLFCDGHVDFLDRVTFTQHIQQYQSTTPTKK